MPKLKQKEVYYGSQYWLQQSVNQYNEIINSRIRIKLNLNANDQIEWLSPMSNDDHSEYQDKDFLKRLSIDLPEYPLNRFWPDRGAVWDGLAKTDRGDILLVEAKAHITELQSNGCQAGQKSLSKIEKSLYRTASYYGATQPENWTGMYYQYANRLAHLYLLRELNHLNAWLIFVYFLNDTTVNGPSTIKEWNTAIDEIHHTLGLGKEIPYVVDLFIDINDMP